MPRTNLPKVLAAQRRPAGRSRDLVGAPLRNVDPAVAWDRDHRGAGIGRVQVDVDPGQHENVVTALHGGLPGVRAHDQEADPVVDRRRAVGPVQGAEHVGHPLDVAAQALHADVQRRPSNPTSRNNTSARMAMRRRVRPRGSEGSRGGSVREAAGPGSGRGRTSCRRANCRCRRAEPASSAGRSADRSWIETPSSPLLPGGSAYRNVGGARTAHQKSNAAPGAACGQRQAMTSTTRCTAAPISKAACWWAAGGLPIGSGTRSSPARPAASGPVSSGLPRRRRGLGPPGRPAARPVDRVDQPGELGEAERGGQGGRRAPDDGRPVFG